MKMRMKLIRILSLLKILSMGRSLHKDPVRSYHKVQARSKTLAKNKALHKEYNKTCSSYTNLRQK